MQQTHGVRFVDVEAGIPRLDVELVQRPFRTPGMNPSQIRKNAGSEYGRLGVPPIEACPPPKATRIRRPHTEKHNPPPRCAYQMPPPFFMDTVVATLVEQ